MTNNSNQFQSSGTYNTNSNYDEVNDEETLNDTEESINAELAFYWKQARENILTPSGIRMFQVAYGHRNEPYAQARKAFELEYETLSPRLNRKMALEGVGSSRHGVFSTAMSILEEMGLMYRETKGTEDYLSATPAADQAAILLTKLPETLRIIPYFMIELLSRYRFNNPLNRNPKNPILAKEVTSSDLFPYWALYKIIRECNDRITKEELARFVFRTKNMTNISSAISQIHAFRNDVAAGITRQELDNKYPAPLPGTYGQPKFIMGRAGVQTGVIRQENNMFYFNPQYIQFIDQVLAEEPQFEELDAESWMRHYGDPLDAVNPEYVPFDVEASSELLEPDIKADDEILLEVKRLLKEDKFAGVILVGPPGTGKTWYARQIAAVLAGGYISRIREVQFHPSYQYEDFVEGYVPDGKGGFRLVDRHLLEMCRLARHSGQTYVLIIDELSRTDPARVMGEAMTYMESSLRGQRFYLPSGRHATIPDSLVFLATMNPEDRSVDDIDAAMDRRWSKVYLAPDLNVLNKFLSENGMSANERRIVSQFFDWIQQHHKLGHAFFRTVRDRSSLERLWNNQLRFLFEKKFRYEPDLSKDIQERWETMLTNFSSANTIPDMNNQDKQG